MTSNVLLFNLNFFSLIIIYIIIHVAIYAYQSIYVYQYINIDNRHVTRGGGRRSSLPFPKTGKKCPNFGKKCHDCGHLWLKFLI